MPEGYLGRSTPVASGWYRADLALGKWNEFQIHHTSGNIEVRNSVVLLAEDADGIEDGQSIGIDFPIDF